MQSEYSRLYSMSKGKFELLSSVGTHLEIKATSYEEVRAHIFSKEFQTMLSDLYARVRKEVSELFDWVIEWDYEKGLIMGPITLAKNTFGSDFHNLVFGKSLEEIEGIILKRSDHNWEDSVVKEVAKALSTSLSEEEILKIDKYEFLDELRRALNYATQMQSLGERVMKMRDKVRLDLGIFTDIDLEEYRKRPLPHDDIGNLVRQWKSLLEYAKGRVGDPLSKMISAIYALEVGIGGEKFVEELESIILECLSSLKKDY